MPHLGPASESRNQVFQRLKPACVALSQTTIALGGPRGSVPELVARLGTLHQVITTPPATAALLDEKLADYVFFPLSQVLKLSQRVSLRSLELTIAILVVLVKDGWKQHVQVRLAAQILILCTLLASEKPSGLASSQTTVELRTNSLRCLESLFTALQGSASSKGLLEGEHNVPQVGQTFTTILDALELSDDGGVQKTAMESLHAMIRCVNDIDMIASFLPGLVSKLTRVLIPKTKQRRHHEILIGCFDILGELLTTILHNDRAIGENAVETKSVPHKPPTIDAKYLDAAATQIKVALTGIFRLKNHDRSDIRRSLAQLCLRVLTICNQALTKTTSLALETMVFISASSTEVRSQLQLAMGAQPSLALLLQDVLHGLLQSLTRTMQSSDETLKAQKLEQIRVAYEMLSHCGASTVLLEREINNALRDSVIVTIQTPTVEHPSLSSIKPVQALDLKLMDRKSSDASFATALVTYRGQEEILNQIESLVACLSQRSTVSSVLITDIARSLQGAQGDALAAQFWLLYVAVSTVVQRKDGVDSLPRLGQDAAIHSSLDELYSLSLTLLNDSSDQPTDNRMKSLALRGLALQAQVAGEEFKYELIDALYPVLHTLATPDQTLQRDSITALEIVTRACGYGSTQDLIVSNVDYLTNAVALKLNAFDISPQAPQVLLMMVRLAGPRLLPYLEDTVESIFAALEDFHGYPLLVELLFRVLNVMAEEGAKAPQLRIAASASQQIADVLKESSGPLRMEDLIKSMRGNSHESRASEDERVKDLASGKAFPRRPWAYDEVGLSSDDSKQEEDDAMARHDQQAADEEVPPPAPKTYALLLKITDLTQHFLPSASPSLRASLLGLISTTVPALAQHENSFLPLINTLWPEITARLDDDEAHVRATALEIIAAFCKYGENFMRSRIIDLWPILVDVHKNIINEFALANGPDGAITCSKKRKSIASTALAKRTPEVRKVLMCVQSGSADYSDTSIKMLWHALVEVIATAVDRVALPPELFDEALQMIELALEPKIAAPFRAENADALWLVEMRSGRAAIGEAPTTAEGRSWRWAAVPG